MSELGIAKSLFRTRRDYTVSNGKNSQNRGDSYIDTSIHRNGPL